MLETISVFLNNLSAFGWLVFFTCIVVLIVGLDDLVRKWKNVHKVR